MSQRIPVAVLGATGVVGQRFVERLAVHPGFELRHLAASEASVGKRYADACSWRLGSTPYGGLEDEIIRACTPDEALCPVVFSALDSAPAGEIEPAFAAAGAMVFSNASAFRMAEDVPLLVPEVNAAHLGMVEIQRRLRGWSGGIVCNPNCTATVLVMGLAPLHESFEISALCHRAAVVDGHMEAISVRLRGNPDPEQVAEAMRTWNPEPQRLGLHTAPQPPIRLHTQPDRPQPRIDVERTGGMPVHVGRIRTCPLLGIKFSLLGHNTQRGAAGASVLNAELADAKGLL